MRSLKEIKRRYAVDNPLILAEILETLDGDFPAYELGQEAVIHAIPELVKMVEERDARITELEMQARLRGGG